ncbi:hypothetical protein [Spiroplasma endosymbiont of Clivina fossor]|uniref:hypothetical protein n=1 Tax=Spiroplasma endosymbiont of Clivina fossor TaxID=3066282 RepID=UPI00313DE7BD
MNYRDTEFWTGSVFLQEELIYLNVFKGRDIVFELSNPVLVHLVCETCPCHKVIHLSEDMHLSDEDFQDNFLILSKTLDIYWIYLILGIFLIW